jgi:hypothetical protein
MRRRCVRPRSSSDKSSNLAILVDGPPQVPTLPCAALVHESGDSPKRSNPQARYLPMAYDAALPR